MTFLRQSIITGLSFGLTSGIITTLGLMVGLHSGTDSKSVVLGGILVIAIADGLSDALGVHISQESNKKSSQTDIWESTLSTFLSKVITALTFALPVIFLDLSLAINLSIGWGIFLIALLSIYIAKLQKDNPFQVVLEHEFITILVIIVTHLVGDWVNQVF